MKQRKIRKLKYIKYKYVMNKYWMMQTYLLKLIKESKHPKIEYTYDDDGDIETILLRYLNS